LCGKTPPSRQKKTEGRRSLDRRQKEKKTRYALDKKVGEKVKVGEKGKRSEKKTTMGNFLGSKKPQKTGTVRGKT